MINDKYTSELARHERIKAVALADGKLTIENGELTSKLKVRRRGVNEKYQALIDRLYADQETLQAASQH